VVAVPKCLPEHGVIGLEPYRRSRELFVQSKVPAPRLFQNVLHPILENAPKQDDDLINGRGRHCSDSDSSLELDQTTEGVNLAEEANLFALFAEKYDWFTEA
jgi:hypothetical protein